MNNRKKTIINKTNSRSGLNIGIAVLSHGRTVAEKNDLRSGEKMEFDPGDVLVLITDKRSNYAVQTGAGTLLFGWQVTNSHPDFPDKTVTAYKMRFLDEDDQETSEHDGADDSGSTLLRSSGDGDDKEDIIVIEPKDPEP
ncbi:hypothetical protein [Natronogracilivirga saccharolytica]|uniref:Uncharacterized protein n=1 Tax=Natronogracilivirga saccharolytica TaxID=2812953 RepID=A0A8J7UUN0_9BACT|nr:hypothetical protein [Natronogracilivirga saccharolytica]MBP3192575.1 hypothetical protein [Natronogracilivirga saccharolytica]